MNVLVTGAEGQLGRTLVRTLASHHEVVGLGHNELDLTNGSGVAATVRNLRPDAVVNCAAYNDVDGAEDDPVTAFAVNALAVRTLAQAASRVDGLLVHYSTDFVFDGLAVRPYREDAAPNPQSVYAMSKLVGEWFARDVPSYVLRVESLFGGFSRPQQSGSSLDRMARLILEDQRVHAFTDRTVSPSYAIDVAAATASLLRIRPPHGLYHCVGSGFGTWHEVATELAGCLGRNADIVPVQMTDRPLKAARPAFCALSNEKLADAGVTMPTWKDALQRYAQAHVRRDNVAAT